MHEEVPSLTELPVPQQGAPPVGTDPNRPDGLRYEGDAKRLRILLWVFGLLIVALLLPDMVERITYSFTLGKERAEAEVAKKTIQDLNLDQMSLASSTLAKAVRRSVVHIRTEGDHVEGQGSGVIMDKDGYIVTNEHVIHGVYAAEIQLSDGRRGPATLVGADRAYDIAVLKTELTDLVPAEWGDSDELEVGDFVWAIGSPFGLKESITFGIISAKQRRGITRRSYIYQEFLQTDAAVNPGNSGGPLVNCEGKVIGINTAIVGDPHHATSYQGISLSIPSSLVKATYEEIRENGMVTRAYLGVEPKSVQRDVARKLGIEEGRGVLLTRVMENTPAEEAGMEPGDVILSWDGHEVNDPTVMSRAIAATEIGSEVAVEVMRDSEDGPERLTLQVRVVSRPAFDSF